MPKALLLMVGADTGNAGARSPIFADGSFEYIPITEDYPSTERRTYSTIIGRKGKPLADYLPFSVRNKPVHYDPEYETFTYGDPTIKREYLLELEPGDLLVFFSPMEPNQNSKYEDGRYITGYFTIKEIAKASHEREADMRAKYPNNSHCKRIEWDRQLIIAVGDPDKCKLLDKAIKISEKTTNSANQLDYVLTDSICKLLGLVKKSIKRSATKLFVDDKHLQNLKKMLGIE